MDVIIFWLAMLLLLAALIADGFGEWQSAFVLVGIAAVLVLAIAGNGIVENLRVIAQAIAARDEKNKSGEDQPDDF